VDEVEGCCFGGLSRRVVSSSVHCGGERKSRKRGHRERRGRETRGRGKERKSKEGKEGKGEESKAHLPQKKVTQPPYSRSANKDVEWRRGGGVEMRGDGGGGDLSAVGREDAFRA
jgi:hypothetical protein